MTNKRQLFRVQYRKYIQQEQNLNTAVYTNDLHEALLAKNSPNF